MSIYAIGDTHLSFSVNKSMDIFRGWGDYTERLESNWRALVNENDTVVIAGDVSWAMKPQDAVEDLAFLHSLPGRKLIMKGNHDYWWQTKKKLDELIASNGFDSLNILFNNSYLAEGYAICGSRGWFFDDDSGDDKVLNREAGRLTMSLQAGMKLVGDPAKLIVFLHYPPVTMLQQCDEIITVLKRFGVKRCYYAHLHGPSHKGAVNGDVDGITFRLISADYLRFCPLFIN